MTLNSGRRAIHNTPKWRARFLIPWVLAFFCLPSGAKSEKDHSTEGEVVVYTALDELYSAPILKAFEARSGIRARCVYDSEAAKTVGLVSRLRAEAARPHCDVFWNNEILHTLELQRDGLLERYQSQASLRIPAPFRDPDGYWTGFAARLRVIAFNTDHLTSGTAPHSLNELLDPHWKRRVGMSYPLFGTNATHAAVLFACWGEERAKTFYTGLKGNDVKILEGNMTAARAVADGELDLCLTDSDDAHLLQMQGRPINFHPADHDGAGALLIPNTVALIKGAPHVQAGRRLIDYLLSPDVEGKLAAAPSAQIPLQPGVPAGPLVTQLATVPRLDPKYAQAARQFSVSAPFLKKLFSSR